MTPARLTLYRANRAAIGTILAALSAELRPTAAGYIIDVMDPVGVLLATAMRQKFGRPSFTDDLVRALAGVRSLAGERSQLLVTGLVSPEALADVAEQIAATIAGDRKLGRHVPAFAELARELPRKHPAGCFQVAIVGDDGADVDVVPLIDALKWQEEPINPKRPPPASPGILH